jgi:predicted amidohydrolase
MAAPTMTLAILHPDRSPPEIDQGWATYGRAMASERQCALAGLQWSEDDHALVQDCLVELCRRGVPEATAEAAMGLPGGEVARWRSCPAVPGQYTARHWGDECARATAEAEAELAATLQRRGATDARTAQWLLERRSPGRWSPASDDAMAQARREGADEERGRLTRSGWTPPPSDGGLRLPLKE